MNNLVRCGDRVLVVRDDGYVKYAIEVCEDVVIISIPVDRYDRHIERTVSYLRNAYSRRTVFFKPCKKFSLK